MSFVHGRVGRAFVSSHAMRQQHAWSWTPAPPMLVWKCMLTSRSQLVSQQRWIWGIWCAQMTKHTSEGIHNGFETQGRHYHQNSKEVYQWPHKKDSKCLVFFLKKKRLAYSVNLWCYFMFLKLNCLKFCFKISLCKRTKEGNSVAVFITGPNI